MQAAFAENETLALAILRHEAELQTNRGLRTSDLRGGAIHRNRTRRQGVEPKERMSDLRAASSDKTGEPDDLALMQREAHVAKLSGDREPLGAEELLSRRSIDRLGQVLAEGAADHEPNELRLRQIARGVGRDVASVAQDADRIAQSVDLGHTVRDIDARHPASSKLLDQGVQSFGLRLAQTTRRLVEDDDGGAAADRGGDLHELLLSDRQLAHWCAYIDVRADLVEHLYRSALHRGAIDEAAP